MKKNYKKYFPGTIGMKNLVPTGRKLQVTLTSLFRSPSEHLQAAETAQASNKGLFT